MRRTLGTRLPGFTLVELLVVISIVALLVAILLPSLRAARESAKRSVCLSNMHQIGLSVLLYGEENRGAIVHLLDVKGEDAVHWIELLRPYVKNAALCRCPTDRSTLWEVDPFDPVLGVRTTSFVTNSRMTPENDPPIARFEQVKAPATKIFIAELKDNVIGDHFHPASWDSFLGFPEDEIAMHRHARRAHYWFVDGHLEHLAFPRTWKLDQSVNKYDPMRLP